MNIFKRCLVLLIVISFLIPPNCSFAAQASDALFSLALNYYDQGYYVAALHEFSKLLLVDPENEEAAYYIRKIKAMDSNERMKKVSQALDDFYDLPETIQDKAPDRNDLITQELDLREEKNVPAKEPVAVKEPEEKTVSTEKKMDLSVKGEVQVAAGVRSPGEFVWKEANGDLNERNFRILWSDDRHNTYDPAVFDRIRFDIDADNLASENVSAHLNVTVDPWSFTGRSDTFTIAGAGGDLIELELKYWGNTGRTINQIVNTLSNGDAISLPEIKVIDGMTTPTSVASTFSNTFNIPSQKIDYNFMPIREFWLDYKNEDFSFRFFPIAYQDQALTTDDPLGLSNRHTWWEESPWLADWRPGNLNTGAAPDDFSKGIWDSSLAFFTRDSDGLRLTSLRGFSFGLNEADTKLFSTFASPKNLWADYAEFNTYAWATRFTHDVFYNFGIGLTNTVHAGYHSGDLDGLNNVFSADFKSQPFVGGLLNGQVAASDSYNDKTYENFSTEKRGYAYLVSLINRFPIDDIYDKGYNDIRKKKDEDSFLKSRISIVRMDKGFDASLSSYRQTRDDEFWSRHISFRKHPLYLYTGLSSPMSFYDIGPFAIGDGIDSNRNVMSIRLEGSCKFLDRDLDGLFDVRNVHDTHGSFIENVSRLELTYKPTDNLTTKLLGISQDMPDTVAGYDPYIFDPETGDKYVNTAISGGDDPSLKTVSVGMDYKINDKVSVNAVWEHTNDSTVATDNYPRGLFNSSSFVTVTEEGKVYREPIPFLYSQTGFDLPPYDYFEIYKFGLSFSPTERLEFYLDLAFNENKKAGQIDDNMNHFGLEIAWLPVNKLSLLFKYTYSRWVDMLKLNDTGLETYKWHNNFFIETRYSIDKSSELIFDYGVGGITPLGSATYDPFGGALAVLDTQHIMRLYYKKRF